MQTNNIIMDQEYKSFSSKGSTDARVKQEISVDNGMIKPAARNAYYKIKAQYTGIVEKAKIQYEQTQTRIEELKSELNVIKNKLEDLKIMSFLKLVFYYTLPGWIYVVGDVMFSMELIVKGWGLGGNNLFEQYALGIAIGLAPFFVKHIIDRFFEPKLETGSPQVKKWLTGTYFGLGLLMVFSFCQIAYVRSVFFRFMNTDSGDGNLYNQLFDVHGVAVSSAFVLVALMFVIGGGFLLSISSREFSKRKEYKTLISSMESKQIEFESKLNKLSDIKMKQVEVEELLGDWNNKAECIEHLETELKYAYKNGFTTELTSSLDSTFNHINFEDTTKVKDNFHKYTRYLVDQYSMNNKGKTYNA